jgi:hypothetical protein
MKRIVLGILAFVCFAFAGATGSVAAPVNGAAIASAASANSLIEQAYVYRRSVYRGNRYGGCRRVRTCGPNGCVFVRRCWKKQPDRQLASRGVIVVRIIAA